MIDQNGQPITLNNTGKSLPARQHDDRIDHGENQSINGESLPYEFEHLDTRFNQVYLDIVDIMKLLEKHRSNKAVEKCINHTEKAVTNLRTAVEMLSEL